MFLAALFTVAKRWERPKCPSTDEGIKKMSSIDRMEYYPVFKKEKGLQYATKNNVLSRKANNIAKLFCLLYTD